MSHVIRWDAERGSLTRFIVRECGCCLYHGPDGLPMAAEFRGVVTVEEESCP